MEIVVKTNASFQLLRESIAGCNRLAGANFEPTVGQRAAMHLAQVVHDSVGEGVIDNVANNLTVCEGYDSLPYLISSAEPAITNLLYDNLSMACVTADKEEIEELEQYVLTGELDDGEDGTSVIHWFNDEELAVLKFTAVGMNDHGTEDAIRDAVANSLTIREGQLVRKYITKINNKL